MKTRLHLSLIGLALGLLTACSTEDFTGAYRLPEGAASGETLLVIEGKKAHLISVDESGEIRVRKLLASAEKDRLFLDNRAGDIHMEMVRTTDGRSLVCINCKVDDLPSDQTHWAYAPIGLRT